MNDLETAHQAKQLKDLFLNRCKKHNSEKTEWGNEADFCTQVKNK